VEDVTDLGRLLGYGDDGRDLADRITKDWAGEFLPGRDFEVVTGEPLRAFKRVLGLRAPGALGRRARACIVLFERGVDLVSTKTDKPLGASLRAYLVDEVLPRLRRGEAVVPVATPALPAVPAPQGLAAAEVEAMLDRRMAPIIDLTRAILALVTKMGMPVAPPAPAALPAPVEVAASTEASPPVLAPTPPPASPIEAAPAPEPSTLPPLVVAPCVVPALDDYLSATRMSARLTVALQRPVSPYAVGRAATNLGFRDRPELYKIDLGRRSKAEGEAAIYRWRGDVWVPLLTYFRTTKAVQKKRAPKAAPEQTPLPLAGAH
jgi:hypothetical protein